MVCNRRYRVGKRARGPGVFDEDDDDAEVRAGLRLIALREWMARVIARESAWGTWPGSRGGAAG